MNSFCKIVYSITLLTTLYSNHVFCMDIFNAARTGNTDRVRELLNAAPESARIALVNQQDDGGWTPLHVAVNYGYKGIARMLIDAGALVNQQDSPLHVAASEGHADIAQMLIDAVPVAERPDLVKQQDNNGWSPLNFATYFGHTCIARMFLDSIPESERLALVNQQQTYTGWAPLHFAADSGQTDIARIFIATGARLDAKDKQGQTPSQTARANHHPEIANLIESTQQRIASARLQKTIIAQTMAQAFQERLGAESPVGMIGQDLLRYVTVLIGQANEQEARQQE